MPWITGGLALAGGLLSSASNRSAASQASDAQIRAAEIAAEASKFKPIGTTTRFGSSQYGYGPGGELTSAGYTVAPDIAAMRESAIGQAGGYLGQAGGAMSATAPALGAAQGMFSLGQEFMPTSAAYSASPESQAYAAQLRGLSSQILPSSYDTTAAAQQYMQQQQALLQPGREQSYAALQQQLQNTGRGGFSVAQGGALGAANPEMQAYYNAIAQSDAALAAGASDKARANLQGDITFGTGLAGTALSSQQNAETLARQNLFGNIQAGQNLTSGGLNTLTGAYNAQQAAYSPYTTAMGTATGLEGFGAGAFDMSNAMAGRTTGANQVGASGMLSAANAAATRGYNANATSPWATGAAALANNPQFVSGVSNWMNPQAPRQSDANLAYQINQQDAASWLR